MNRKTKYLIISLLFFVMFLSVNNVYASFVKKIEKQETITTNKKEAILIQGDTFNSKIISLAGSAGSIKNIVRSNTLNINPSNANIVSTNDSSFPIYAWYKNGTIYYYSEVDIYLNQNSKEMFKSLTSLEKVDLSYFKANNVTNFSSLFSGSTLKEIKTPKSYPNDSTVLITLPYEMYDNNLNGYSVLGSSSPTETLLKQAYTVNFDTDGGDSVNSLKVLYDQELIASELPKPNKSGFKFIGWYKANGEVVEDMTLEGDITLYAHWNSQNLLCKKATSLHTDTCLRTDNKGCNLTGYSQTGSLGTTTVVFGNVADTTSLSGDAYDCDVNGDEIFDSSTERFYYMRNNGNNAVLVLFANYEGNEGIKNNDNFSYTTGLTKLPTVTQWPNVSVEYNGYAARLLSNDDILEACGVSVTNGKKFTTACDYLFENTGYMINNTSIARTGMWLEIYNGGYYRINTTNSSIETKTESSNNVIRPVIEVPLSLMDSEPVGKYDVNFDSQGGYYSDSENSIITIKYNKGSVVRELPTPMKHNNEFDGWYTDQAGTTLIPNPLIISGDTTYYAKWSELDNTAYANGKYKDSLQEAVNLAPTTGEKTVVKLFKDVQEKVTISGGRNVVFELNGHTISNIANSNNNTIIVDNGSLEINDGVITNDTASGAINVNSNGILRMNGGTVSATGSKQAIYVDGGKAYIGGNAILSSTTNSRATVHNKTNGTLVITGGTITSTGAYAVYNESGSLTIGEADGIIKYTPEIKGKTYGVIANQKFNYYDGIIMGETYYVGKSTTGNTPTINNDTNETMILNIEDGAVKDYSTESSYKVLKLESSTPKYRINLDADGGTVDEDFITVEQGSEIGILPTPSKGVYTFDGWFTASGTEITSTYVPSDNMDLIAHYHYEVNNNVVSFDIMNDAMRSYYTYISTWKDDESSFQENMDANFNNNSCLACDANPSNPYQSCPISGNGNLCDKSLGYQTGLNENILVYESSEENKEKGNLVSYTTSTDGNIYNMIPGETYYWESSSDSNIYGYVKATGERRILNTSIRNVRDLGGMSVTNGDRTGKLKYGKMFRGSKLEASGDTDKNNLAKLGITEEIDLRGSSSDAKLDNYQARQIVNYEIDPENYLTNYNKLRSALVSTMQDIINDEKVYFHCAIGTDRTGTLAYILEGLLGVSDEEKIQDYELSYFYGLLNRHRFYSEQPGSSITHRFMYMYNLYPTNDLIYQFFMFGSENEEADRDLIDAFRTAMIDYDI